MSCYKSCSYIFSCVFLLQDYVIQGDAAAAPAANNQNEAAPNNPPPAPPPQPQGAGLGAAHQAMLQGGGPVGFQSYKRPRLFYFRVRKIIREICGCFEAGICNLHLLFSHFKFPEWDQAL